MVVSLARSHPRQLWAELFLNRLLRLPLCTRCDRRVVMTMSGTDPVCDPCAEPR
jgi:hypothetical protein